MLRSSLCIFVDDVKKTAYAGGERIMLHTQQYYFEFELESFVFRLFLPNYWLVGVGTSPGPSQNRPTVPYRSTYRYCTVYVFILYEYTRSREPAGAAALAVAAVEMYVTHGLSPKMYVLNT